MVRLTHLHLRVGLKTTIIDSIGYPAKHHFKCTVSQSYNIYGALRSAVTTPAYAILDIDFKLWKFKVENKKLHALGKY